MKSSRALVICCIVACLLFYGLMITGEAARQVAGIGFARTIEWNRMYEALDHVGWRNFRMIGFEPWDYLAWFGMGWVFIFAVRGRRISPWASAAYLAVLLGAGGWVGLVCAFYLPYNLLFVFDSMTGEFFMDYARQSACGVWAVLLMIWTGMALRERGERPVLSTQACPIA